VGRDKGEKRTREIPYRTGEAKQKEINGFARDRDEKRRMLYGHKQIGMEYKRDLYGWKGGAGGGGCKKIDGLGGARKITKSNHWEGKVDDPPKGGVCNHQTYSIQCS